MMDKDTKSVHRTEAHRQLLVPSEHAKASSTRPLHVFGNLPFGDMHISGETKKKRARPAYVSRPWLHTVAVEKRRDV